MKKNQSDDGKYLRLISHSRVIPFEDRFLAVYIWYDNWVKNKGSIDKRTFQKHLNIGFSLKIGEHLSDIPKEELNRTKEENIRATEIICKSMFSGESFRNRWCQDYSSLFYWHGKTEAISKNLKVTHYRITVSRTLLNEHTGKDQVYELTYNVSPQDYLDFFVHKTVPHNIPADDLDTVFKTILVLECKYWLD